MAHPILMPKPGQMTEECVLILWRKEVGEAVHRGDVLFEPDHRLRLLPAVLDPDPAVVDGEEPVVELVAVADLQPDGAPDLL